MEPFKNLFNIEVVTDLAAHIKNVHAEFDDKSFVTHISSSLDQLELKQRSNLICNTLCDFLPQNFLSARNVLLKTLHPSEESELSEMNIDESGVRGWIVMPMADFVGLRGGDYFHESMEALKEMTKRFSSEFAVRPFIARETDKSINYLHRWSEDENYHVRRLASEGSRPRLPWGMQLKCFIEDPRPIFPVLRKLRDDPSDYVRKSVANHLNDVSKDHADILVKELKSWMNRDDTNRTRLIKHACRTLIKSGDRGVLKLLGYNKAEVDLLDLKLNKKRVKVGECLEILVRLKSKGSRTQKLVLDYLVYYQKSNGTLSPKVFKWKTFEMHAGEVKVLEKRHSFKPVTTRKLHGGAHKIGLQLNGTLIGELDFKLLSET